jgi:hypothetical protein
MIVLNWTSSNSPMSSPHSSRQFLFIFIKWLHISARCYNHIRLPAKSITFHWSSKSTVKLLIFENNCLLGCFHGGIKYVFWDSVPCNTSSMAIQLWKPINLRNLEDGGDSSPKRRFELVLHGTKSQKTYLIDTPLRESQKTVVFEY